MHGGRMFEEVTFERDCPAVIVPDGIETVIPGNTIGYITQVLGGNFTLQMSNGYLVRVSGKDADAVGREPEPEPEAVYDDDGKVVVTPDQVVDQLRKCYDPEIPVNIMELGLVYRHDLLDAQEQGHEGHYRVEVDMTLTAPGCGMGQVLIDDVEHAMRRIPGVAEVMVDLTFDPPWSPERMSDEARLELGFM